MEPTRGADRTPDPNASNLGKNERPPVRRVVRQRQPPVERGRPSGGAVSKETSAAPAAPTESEEAGPRVCPFCGEAVSPQAVVCRHCGRDLVAGSGARLVLPEEKWNTSVPAWMIAEEQEFLRRKKKISLLRSKGRTVFLALVILGVVAILYVVYTAPIPPHLRLRVAGKAGHESSASRLAMASESHEPAVTVAPAASEGEQTTVDTAAKPSEDHEVPTPLTTAKLVRTFEQDHDHANELYQDQLVRLSGSVETVHTETEVPYLTLHSPTTTEVRCYLNASAVGKLGRLRPGAAIVIQGRCQGWFTRIAIADCDLP